MTKNYFGVDIDNSHVDNGAAVIKIHISEDKWDGGPRIIIRYRSVGQYDEEYDTDEKFVLDKNYNISVDKEELIDLRDCINKSLEIWPLVLPGQ